MQHIVKALIKPPLGDYLISDLPEGGLLERGGFFTKSSDKDIFGSFSALLSHILQNQDTILWLKYVKFNTVFIPKHAKINMQGCVAK